MYVPLVYTRCITLTNSFNTYGLIYDDELKPYTHGRTENVSYTAVSHLS